MIIGHLPAGYLVTRAYTGLLLKRAPAGADPGRLLLVGTFSGVAPDLDMIYFYLIDRGGHLHHSYWTHLPVFWAVVGTFFLIAARISGHDALLPYISTVFVGIMSHFLLDTVTGGVRWFYPFSEKYLFLFQVPPIYEWWVLNFMFHWTFIFEVAFAAAAGWDLLYRWYRRCQST